MNHATLSKSTSNRLHTVRWCAALVVVLGHVEMVAKWRTGVSIWPWAYQMAHLAVMAFFVLSGFIIAHVSMRTSGLSAFM
jgi:peptidoglycan/LPS O-acetylase OafA/YrhL